MKLALLTFGSVLSANAAVLGERFYARDFNKVVRDGAPQVIGKAEGFASGVTGGGNATCFTAETPDQLREWLEDDIPRCIVLRKEFDFKFKEGFTTELGCRPSTNTCPDKGGQDAINKNGWCDDPATGQNTKPVNVTYDNAAMNPINVASNKSLIGIGKNGVIRGKGLHFANGVSNVIVQNVVITELNPQYIWGGDAISMDGAEKIWIDHCRFTLIGNQMFVSSSAAANSVTVSNTEFNGHTNWSESCDGRHYWTFLAFGANDKITLKGNNIHHTSGRSPKLGGNTFLHAVNNLFASNTGNAFDLNANTKVLLEGNVFKDVKNSLLNNGGVIFAASGKDDASCTSVLSRACQANYYFNSPTIVGTAISALDAIKGYPIPGIGPANDDKIEAQAGVGKL